MEAYVLDWLSLLVRWAHLVVGIAWIGASFYFVWLDNHLEPPADPEDKARGVGGELWAVHGGGFYNPKKYLGAPPKLPATLHWFKWEAYWTFITGFFLLCLLYYASAEIYLIDKSVMALSKPAAIAIGLAFIAGGWGVYHALCNSPLGNKPGALSAVLAVLLAIAAWGLCHLFSGRGAYIHFGAMLGTIMVANVAMVIMPAQRGMVAACAEGRTPDPAPAMRAKQRSVHNTYFTLPVLFVMISNHYAMAYGHPYNWAILIAISLAGAAIRTWFVARHKGKASPWPLVAGLATLAIVAVLIAPRAPAPDAAGDHGFARVSAIVKERCASCHAARPTHEGFAAPPLGVLLETPDQVATQATRIGEVVATRTMPIGNLTHMTDAERAAIAAWIADGAKR